jgi:hypothetical protein
MQVSPSTLQIPCRSDRLPCKTEAGVNVHDPHRQTPAQLQEALIMDAIRLVCKLSRQEMPLWQHTAHASEAKQARLLCLHHQLCKDCSSHCLTSVKHSMSMLGCCNWACLSCLTVNHGYKLILKILTFVQENVTLQAHPSQELTHGGSSSQSGSLSSSNGNGTLAAVATEHAAVDAQATVQHPMMSAAWLLSLEAPSSVKEVQEGIEQLGRISRHAESEMIAAVVDSDHVVLKLFDFSGNKDVFSFVSYVRAHLIRTGRLEPKRPPLKAD